ncbi:alpha/beta hydrolase [Actinocorallia longicatena]|uniref:Alpha/beta hydrolase-fold protein n=1 Tax=Actinocorallia longicatena TaxID=111803 RepID=A0ABP6QAF2_9ACTN
MFGPQGAGTVFVLITLFVGFVALAIRFSRWWIRGGAVFGAFLPAMLTGFVFVNQMYAYYPSWGALWGDLTGTPPTHVVTLRELSEAAVREKAASDGKAAKRGLLVEASLPGPRSGITRDGLVYLPPQYFQEAYKGARFPALELLHGAPGNPYDYDRVMDIVGTYRKAARQKKARPAVLVMPDSNGGQQNALQCLNVKDGPQDETYLVDDVTAVLVEKLRVRNRGTGWGIAGFSEGGFCATNLMLRHPRTYKVAGVMSGYFTPLPVVKKPEVVDPFGGSPAVRAANDPQQEVAAWPVGRDLGRFWFAAGGDDQRDMLGTEGFIRQLRRVQPQLVYQVVPGGTHSFGVWRQACPKFLRWALRQLPGPAGAAPRRGGTTGAPVDRSTRTPGPSARPSEPRTQRPTGVPVVRER